ncbi:MAG: hypothetical protein F6K19_05450 [Cyanothece sp. SIO1E1]|nr:hypothetical protein [Cyanothece sp. SIO1E1]
MKTFYVIASLLMLSLLSCKTTYLSQANQWNQSKARLERLAQEYPNFSMDLQKQLAEAEEIYDQVEDQIGEEAKKEMLSQANRKASGGYIYQLDNWEKKVEKLRLDAIQLFEYAEKHKDFVIAGLKSDNIELIVNDMQAYLVSIEVSDQYQAQQVVEKAVGKLNRIQKVVTTNLREIERRKKEEETATQAAN